jgi:hypothetical protein
MEVEAKVRFMGEIVMPCHPCSTWNERKGYLQHLSWRPYFCVEDCATGGYLQAKYFPSA